MSTSSGKTVTVQGRLVSVFGGSLWKGSPKVDDRTKQPVFDKAGQPVIDYGFRLAIPKHLMTQENFADGKPFHFYGAAYNEAFSLYANGVPEDFAWKWTDGDSPKVDKKGLPYNKREGWAGHWILSCSTRIPFPVFKFENNSYIQISEGVNNGDYVTVQLAVKAHLPQSNTSKPGMYFNPTMLLLSMKGEPIVGASRDPAAGFGSVAPQTASWMVPASTPQAPAGFGQFANGMAPQQAPMIPGMPQQQQAPPMPQAPAAPHYGTLPQAHQPAPAQQAYMPPMPQQPAQGYAPPQAPMMPQQHQAPPMPQAPAAPMMPGMPYPYPQ